MKTFKEFRLDKAKALVVTIDWEHGNPNEYSAEWEDEGVFVHDYNKRKNLMTVTGTEASLERWLDITYGVGKRGAKGLMKSAKPARR